MSIRSNLDTSTVCLQQADATVLSRRGSYFYFSMRAVKASQNKQTQAKLLLFFFFFPALCPLLFGRAALLPFTAGSPHGEMQCQRTAAFWWSTHVSMKSIYSLFTCGKPSRPYTLYISVFLKQHFLRMSGSFSSVKMWAILQVNCDYLMTHLPVVVWILNNCIFN